MVYELFHVTIFLGLFHQIIRLYHLPKLLFIFWKYHVSCYKFTFFLNNRKILFYKTIFKELFFYKIEKNVMEKMYANARILSEEYISEYGIS